MSSPASENFLDETREQLGDDAVLVQDADRSAYEDGWRYGSGRARAVIRPRTSEELAALLQRAATAGLRIQPIGANTGLVGASNPDESGEQIVVSTERLTPKIELDLENRAVLVGAGTTLNQLNAELEESGLFFPVDLGADPQIGGMIATNTGGTRLIRYGAVRDHVLGLEVVLPSGKIWSDLGALRKDNRGLDSKQIFIGSSGSYGIISRAVLSLEPRPKQTVTAWAALENGAGALALLAFLEERLGECLSAYEVLSREAYEITLRHGANISRPFDVEGIEFAALIELSTTLRSGIFDLEAAMMETLEEFVTEHEDAVIDVTPQSPNEAWHIRHQVSESLRHEGSVLALDIAVPRSRIGEFSARVRGFLAEESTLVRAADFGHWGDGGTHMNLLWDPAEVDDEPALKARLQSAIYEICVEEFAGSFSAEHGIGPHNQGHFDRFAKPLSLALGRVLKEHFDPERRFGTVRFEEPEPKA